MKATSKSGYGRGWHKQSVRHSNAARYGRAGGIYSNMTYSQLKKAGIRLDPNKDSDGDGVKNKDDCRPLNAKEQGAVHKIDTLLDKAENKAKTPEQKKKILEARADLQKATTKEKIKAWAERHRAGLSLAGRFLGASLFPAIGLLLGGQAGLAIGTAAVLGIPPVIAIRDYTKMQNESYKSERFDELKKLSKKQKLTDSEKRRLYILKEEFKEQIKNG